MRSSYPPLVVAGFLSLGAAPLAATSPFHFASVDEGRVAITQADGFYEAMSAYELKLRAADLGRASRDDVRAQSRAGVVDWSPAGKARVEASLQRISGRMAIFEPLLPARVDLVAVTAAVEDDLPHTRGTAIFLPSAIDSVSDDLLDFVMAHEIFHVLSRASTVDRNRFYASIGFRPCQFEAPSSLVAVHITNPDAPVDGHYITVGTETFVPYVYGRSADVSAPLQLGENLMTRLVSVKVANGRCTPIVAADGGPVLKKASDVAGFFDVVGKDSTYVTHPEELLADNFALLITDQAKSKSPDKLQQIEADLTAAAAEAVARHHARKSGGTSR
jgi:hypothetical protein